jgi:anti-sigma B factor antagonist
MADGATSVKEVREDGDVIIIVLEGEIDMHHTPEVHVALREALRRQPPHIVVNLELVNYMDSSGVGALVKVLRDVAKYQGKLSLCNVGPRVMSVFEITKLDQYFDLFGTESEALAR